MNLANKITVQDARDKMWELQKISLSRQPQTQDDASSLTDSFNNIIDNLNDIIRIGEGKESKADLQDGELVMVN